MYTYNLFALVCIHSRCLCTRLCNIGVLFHLYMYIHHLQQVCTCLHLFVSVLVLVCMSAPGTTCFHVPVLVCIWHHSFSLISAWHHLFLFACTCLVCI